MKDEHKPVGLGIIRIHVSSMLGEGGGCSHLTTKPS